MNEPQHEHPQDTPAARAEILVDQWGERVGKFLSSAGYQLRKAAARAREEAEDIWAEAQAIRHNEHSQQH
ncbi:MAG TPA: hypothetical protein VF099_13670 [Ktedonobacterales bacterium]